MKILTSLDQWNEWSKAYSTLPFLMKIPINHLPIRSWTSMWKHSTNTTFLLESCKGGRYTYLSNKPRSIIRGKGLQAEILDSDPEKGLLFNSQWVQGPPLYLVKNWMAPYRSPQLEGHPHFLGGCVGYWGYDVVRLYEKIPNLAQDDLSLPDYCFARYDELWIIDHAEHTLTIAINVHLNKGLMYDGRELRRLYTETQKKAAHLRHEWKSVMVLDKSHEFPKAIHRDQLDINEQWLENMETAFTKRAYIQAVLKIQDYIRQGDVFQVNLSVRQSLQVTSSPEAIYESLRLVNPSPYMGLLRFGDFSLVSGSPELLVQCVGGQLRTRPIAGTRPRGANQTEDQMLAMDLIQNEKERAEHVMLVDLERNDFGRISQYGTVKVKEFMAIEPYSHVMHIVSEINGSLADGKDAFDVIQATFPGGTITGAPKIRTMEIIEELEPVRRGPYTGSMGWIDYNGNLEFNIIIRSLLYLNGVGYVQAGAGIVIDSIPEKEYFESLNKSKAIWKAIEHSQSISSQLV